MQTQAAVTLTGNYVKNLMRDFNGCLSDEPSVNSANKIALNTNVTFFLWTRKSFLLWHV